MADNGDDDQEKSHEPTAEKLRKSREQGDVPYSAEVTQAATYIALFVIVLLVAGWSMKRVHHLLARFFEYPTEISGLLMNPDNSGFIFNFGVSIFGAIAPIFALLAVGAVVSIVAQRGATFAPSKIKPKLNRLSVISNAKQKYGPNGLMEFAKNVAKLSAVLGIVLFASRDRFFDLPFLAGLDAAEVVPLMQRETIFFLGFVTATAAAIAAIDLPWKYFEHKNRQKMTAREVKEEHKSNEGDPHMKQERRQRAQVLAMNQMMQEVPDANVVIVNPTHYAVALKWDRENGGVPICVAKGVDEVAARIREAAAEAGVPIRRDPPTARSIFALVDIGDEIQREHYAAVAAAIHFADEIRSKAKAL